ncbi:MAG: methenyltetrahydrofolate cyclohydrolase [Methylothermaceae bacteria B42]|nr:MAG: methenyltetrahydrofolate cyclohydrolase [Methylothermaceae bacteria B42]HHJ39313.1 methenyltetrahydrofolate cyclohydrolase [Methylothermaceae bacterium]
MIKDQTIETFLQQLASASATPGGGSAAAIMGSMGAALVSMVANLTIGKDKYKAVEADMQALLEEAEALRICLLDAVRADVEAFDQVMAAYRLPKNTEEEKTLRSKEIQEALKTATDVPLECVRLSAAVIDLSRTAMEKGNRNVISDAGVAVLAAHAALKSSALNVYVNLNAIQDTTFTKQRREELEKLIAGKDEEVEKIYQQVKHQL